MRAAVIGGGVLVLLLATAALAAGQGAPTPDARAIRSAQAARQAAARRARALDAAADAATDPRRRSQLEELALGARVAVAEAEIALAATRAAATDAALAAQRTRLAAQQGPVARLLAGLTALARRPAIAVVAQPGSLDDLVHVQAVFAATLPQVRERTAAIRDDLARSRALQASAATAAGQLRNGRARLLTAQRTLADLQKARATDAQADRALALGEEARDIVDQLRSVGDEQATVADLLRLPPPPLDGAPSAGVRAYRLPVAGRLVTGLGEVSDNGVRARGLTFAVAPGARVVAPAAGIIRYARPFRGFGTIVILDHGAGWTTLVTGLGSAVVQAGQSIAAGALLGQAPAGPEPQVTVELRRRARPVDITRLLG